eukprot:CAMPEP_0184497614 /NCGR_PEP_ID=MMETSP0113_2-20130426/37020_1 /TAXON_ID=91329 /ORGANISM="Norrisiella sphaerica, Strain BC52" /LENGTH=46 /DNA_ID= /DNA_START= /DNA_END= /DNA_ORIENTATION=
MHANVSQTRLLVRTKRSSFVKEYPSFSLFKLSTNDVSMSPFRGVSG